MLASTKGIVLHFIKYGESSVIATIYTEKFGRQAYIINAARSKNAKNKVRFLQPLFILDLVVYQKPSRDIQRVKEIKFAVPFNSIPFEVTKSTQAIFIAEILYKTLREEESYPKLFGFLENAIHYFDLMGDGTNNFHLFFLIRLTEYIGIHPNTEFMELYKFFDLKKGVFTPAEPSHTMLVNKELTPVFKKLLQLRLNELSTFKITRQHREALLQKLIDYYQLHFEAPGSLKSLPVLKEVFK
ncbi:hypothetical protein MNBD_BACTEROID01-1528 [hydrothermal vent metagenome]|uniref:DNA replication/recombination mediator RecO N-terminal domain-containing protein n=1 Tax=hydrothermal vent metagenome TaxID=652676 RepID=A0A3B0T5V2_9ZZZZ